jgi:hypothetical protein
MPAIKTKTIIDSAHLSCIAALYARNAVLGANARDDALCPKGTKHNDASSRTTTSSKHVVLRNVTASIIHWEESLRQYSMVL